VGEATAMDAMFEGATAFQQSQQSRPVLL
jgi:hypothetical protein